MSTLNRKIKNSTLLIGVLFLIFSCQTSNNTQSNEYIQAGSGYDTVHIKGMQFVPSEIIVNQNDTIVFMNNDMVDHDVTEKQNHVYSDTIRSGTYWIWQADKSMDYFCSIHPAMTGKVIVEP